MNELSTALPNYFIADLPSESVLTPAMIQEACQALKSNRASYLAHMTPASLIEVLATVASSWLKPGYPFRELALRLGPSKTGFSANTIAQGLDSFFKRVSARELSSLILQDLGHTERLREFSATDDERASGRSAIARGPELLVHISGGAIPNGVLTNIILGLLARSAQFVKCASGAAWIPQLFAHSIYEADPKIGACLEIAEWRGGTDDFEQVLFVNADCVTASGRDETLASIRRAIPSKTRFLGYGHRVSFSYVAGGVLSSSIVEPVVEAAADDIVAWNQLGCLSPHVIYVQSGSEVTPLKFGGLLAEELELRESSQPRGELAVATAAAITSRRAFYEIRAAHSPETHVWRSSNSTAWTVVYESDPAFQFSCLNRFIYVKAVADLSEALKNAEVARDHISTVGVAAAEGESAKLARQLAAWGATRVCQIGHMQNPPLTWRHDGRPTLGELVTWTDFEL